MKWSFDRAGEQWHLTSPNGSTSVYGGYFDAEGIYRPARSAFVRMYREAFAALIAAGDLQAMVGEWSALFVPEGSTTSDDREIEKGALYWRDPPLPLMMQTETSQGHSGAELAGSIMSIYREQSDIMSTGTFDDSDAGRQAMQILSEPGRERFGLSVDLGQMEADAVCTEMSEDGACAAEKLVISRGEIIGATMTPFPAFADAYIMLSNTPVAVDTEAEELAAAPAADTKDCPKCGATVPATASKCPECGFKFDKAQNDKGGKPVQPLLKTRHSSTPKAWDTAVVVAAGIPLEPPAEWFQDPRLEQLQAITITDDGEIYGHAAGWGTCHIGIHGTCVTPPRSQSNYAYFNTGAIRVSGCDCEQIPVGQITVGTGHADTDPRVNFTQAASHYDNTGSSFADVACGEDEHGIWVHGAIRPEVTPEQMRVLRAASLSGDWRPVGGAQELVALLAVNVPGFPIPRTHVSLTASGEQGAIVAAGIVPPRTLISTPRSATAADVTELRELISMQSAQLAKQASMLDALRQPVGDALMERVNAAAR